jgi:N-acetylmuramoyl-L-alanine amidase
MKILAHRVDEFRQDSTPNVSGALTAPRFIVMHYTAGPSLGGALATLKDPTVKGKPSAHVVIDRDGAGVQLVPFNVVANHAGISTWQGYNGLNRYSIGIELVNVGYVMKRADGRWRTDFGVTVKASEVIVARHRNGGPERGWQTYPAAQLSAADELCRALLATYSSIRGITGHDWISPGRKNDPGPAFPDQKFAAIAEGRSDPAPDERLFETTASSLNVRGGPGTEFETLDWGPLQRGTIVRVVREREAWRLIELPDDEAKSGFVHSDFLRAA